jgi:glucose-1-phosphate adenylyltransferase
MLNKDCIAMLLAGGRGERLGNLTDNTAKPAVAYGGKYKLIDFSLSNCRNSGINIIGVLTQYRPQFLNSYIGTGEAWGLNKPNGEVGILSPYETRNDKKWYQGTSDAVFQNIEFIDLYNPKYVLILSGDHIYKMNYKNMLKFHINRNAEVTIAVTHVPMTEAHRFGILKTDKNNQITEFWEKPQFPQCNLASMGIYIFNWDVLKNALIEDNKNKNSKNDFGKNIIPMVLDEKKGVYSYLFKGYWRDVGTIESYYEANMDLLRKDSGFNIWKDMNNIYTHHPLSRPQYIGVNAQVKNSLISDGCTILGEVVNSIIFSDVFVDEHIKIKESIVLSGSEISGNINIFKSIISEKTKIDENYSMEFADELIPNITGIKNNMIKIIS